MRALVLLACGVYSTAGSAAAAPAPTQVPNVTAENWYWGPGNRWAWHNARRVFPTAAVGRGGGAVTLLTSAERDLASIEFTDPVTREAMTVGEMLDGTYTDGFLVLQDGKILSESYRNDMTAEQPHLLMSVSKSIIGALAGILIEHGQLAADALVTRYVPEMRRTVYDGATIRNLLDMSVEDPQARAALKSTRGSLREYQAVDEAGGWLPATKTSAPGLRAYLVGLNHPHGQNGKGFLYLDQSTILMGWIMERASGKDLSTLLSKELWSKLGAEQDAYLLLDRHQQAYASAGFNATLRDLGRFGERMAQGGRYNDQQIVPASWVADIRSNGTEDSGPAAPRAWPGHEHGTYRSFWWLSEKGCGRFAGVGLGGQLLIIDPVAHMVIVKFDSVPTPALDKNTFQTEYQGIDAIIRTVSGHGCS